MSTRKLSNVNQFSEKYPAFTSGGLRWHIFNAKQNGLQDTGAIIRIGRSVLIDEDRFFNWIDSQQQVKV